MEDKVTWGLAACALLLFAALLAVQASACMHSDRGDIAGRRSQEGEKFR
ncbi:hypothetical protein SAMN05880570_1873 [Paenibacillus sp. RU4T]|nr:hypothetical protein SAMN05880555_1875 [Paenibacillus sp. RU4X]SIQ70200.1 hypothetical protein SAMN05880570_1873 [Paenibacillus sp. RU4T]